LPPPSTTTRLPILVMWPNDMETAKELRAALERAIIAAEFEEAEVWCKRVLPSLVRAA
jgi:hypothetical protein